MIRESRHVRHCKHSVVLAALILFLIPAITAIGQTIAQVPAGITLGGQPSAPVKIEVFSDYQCPVCRAYYLETLKPLLNAYANTNKVCVVYHDYPLEMHQWARKACRYALAAERISRDLWLRVTDALYTDQAQWSQDGNIDAILSKRVDPTELARIKKLADDPSVEAAVNQEVMLGQSRQITSTPTSFIITEAGRQQRVNSIIPYTVLKDYIDRNVKH